MNPTETSKNESLDRMFRDLLTKSPAPEQLLELVRFSKHLRERAWNAFVEKANPDFKHLEKLFYDWKSRQELCSYPAKMIIEHFPDRHNILLKIIEFGTSELSRDAARAIIAHPDKNALEYVLFASNDQTICEQAGQALLKLSPAEYQLVLIVNNRHTSASKRTAGSILIKLDALMYQSMNSIIYSLPALIPELWQKHKAAMGDFVLETIIESKNRPVCREEAARMLLDRSSEFSPLFHVFRNCPDLREEVWGKLSKIELSETWLQAIKREGPEFADRVDPLLADLAELEKKKRTDPRLAADIIIKEIKDVERATR
jgi:hypothetical protein